jgi:hypothetical protein
MFDKYNPHFPWRCTHFYRQSVNESQGKKCTGTLNKHSSSYKLHICLKNSTTLWGIKNINIISISYNFYFCTVLSSVASRLVLVNCKVGLLLVLIGTFFICSLRFHCCSSLTEEQHRDSQSRLTKVNVSNSRKQTAVVQTRWISKLLTS